MCGRQTGLSDELNHLLQELTTLNRHDNAKVALRARQVCSTIVTVVTLKGKRGTEVLLGAFALNVIAIYLHNIK